VAFRSVAALAAIGTDERALFGEDVGMTMSFPQLTKLPAWQALEAHYPKVRELHLRKLFADDPKRGERMTVDDVGICFDYSKHRITDETLSLLIQLAEESGLRARIDAMFRGRRSTSRRNGPSCTWPFELP